MKQIITCLAVVAFSFAGYSAHAQSANGVSANDKVLLKGEQVIMKDGKALLVTNGKEIALQGNVVTRNGDLVKADGTIVLSSGTATKMKEGQVITPEGKIEVIPAK